MDRYRVRVRARRCGPAGELAANADLKVPAEVIPVISATKTQCFSTSC
jgi:hypothetical protein